MQGPYYFVITESETGKNADEIETAYDKFARGMKQPKSRKIDNAMMKANLNGGKYDCKVLQFPFNVKPYLVMHVLRGSSI